MAIGKWIGGFLGWMAGGPLGALAGIVIGSMLDASIDAVNTPETQGTFGSQGSDAYAGNNGYTRQGYSRQQATQGQRNSFLFSLLVLAAYIIRADGKVMHSEMELVRQMLRQNFGESAVTQGNQILRNLFEFLL